MADNLPPANPRRRSSWRGLALIGLGWAAMNGLLSAALTWYESLPPASEGPISAAALEAFEERSVAVPAAGQPNTREVRYRWMPPPELAKDERYPVLLFLHGSGQRGSDNLCQLRGLPEQMASPEWRSKYPCFLIAPQCPEGQNWSGQMEAVQAILAEVLCHASADSRSAYLTGLSMGGYGAWELAALRPKMFAAVVPICGGGDEQTAHMLSAVPIWAVHGDADEVVPVERSRSMIEAVRQAGGHPRYTELQGVRHDSWTPTYQDPEGVIRWMFQQ